MLLHKALINLSRNVIKDLTGEPPTVQKESSVEVRESMNWKEVLFCSVLAFSWSHGNCILAYDNGCLLQFVRDIFWNNFTVYKKKSLLNKFIWNTLWSILWLLKTCVIPSFVFPYNETILQDINRSINTIFLCQNHSVFLINHVWPKKYLW